MSNERCPADVAATYRVFLVYKVKFYTQISKWAKQPILKRWVDVFCKTFLHEAVKFNWNKQKKLKLKMYRISLGKTRVKCIFPLLSVSKIHLQSSSDTSTATKKLWCSQSFVFSLKYFSHSVLGFSSVHCEESKEKANKIKNFIIFKTWWGGSCLQSYHKEA